MSGPTLNQLVRDQILAEGPEGIDGMQEWYVNDVLRHMTNVELLERISNALDALVPELSVRLGI
jgi:hypothetical protein